ncbi:MAG: cbb3-type cytochrome c oxidase subunit II [Parachlamydia sp.]|jgi:cytochrome c oxidase cbb3-type subunit 2|nr:cbb3-type cytochrome c oxidase subunit II [Parachlamydia sp.]
MNKPAQPKKGFFHHLLDRSAVLTVIGIILLFSTSIAVVLVAPRYVDKTWTTPSTPYQAQMYEIEDPHIYISTTSHEGNDLQYVRHLKAGFSLLAFQESENLRLIAPPELEKYITRLNEKELKLTSRLLLLRPLEEHVRKDGHETLHLLELYDPKAEEILAYEPNGGILQNWVDKDFKLFEDDKKHPYHHDHGVIYAENPQEFRVAFTEDKWGERWRYDPLGKPVQSLEELKEKKFGFHSRQELIHYGEHLYAIEGCWYCHTDQTRTLIQDTVLNGSDSYPAPPSSANEYIYQKITFAGTRRIGPDISREGVKRPSRDWHKAHFWSPKSASAGSVMPSYRHFFVPHLSNAADMGAPNLQFEAIYQYLMTKGTRITPPNQAWWLGKDPIKTKEIIEGQRTLQ